MTAAATQTFLSGFLAAFPIPPLLQDGMVVYDEDTGEPVRSATPLAHFVDWLRSQANEASKRGLAEFAASQLGDPAP